jgi:phage shock protein A
MKKMKRFAFALLLLASPATAQQPQQPPDPAFLQKALSAMQQQRNQAMDSVAVMQAQAEQAREELAKAQERIKQLEAKPADAPPPVAPHSPPTPPKK